MKFFNDFSRFSKGFSNCITTIDSHTEGESTRLIVNGLGDIKGKTMMEKLKWFKSRYDHIRCLLTKEPRGSKEILAAMVTENVTKNAKFGLIYMDAKRYPYLCGHATIGAVTTLAKTGFLELEQGENCVPVDTPSGLMEARVFVQKDKLDAVAINMVPSFVYDTGRQIEVEGFGTIKVDLVCTGGFFVMVDSSQIHMEPVLKNKKILTNLGMKIIDAANEQLSVSHPVRPDVRTIDVTEFYDSHCDEDKASGRGMVVYGESHVDRSPCGTGTAAKLTLLHHYGKIKMNQKYINYSPLGTFFEAMLVKKEKIGSVDGFIVQIKGMACLTGVHHFIVEDEDPFQQGFIM
ncbi:MAG: proline racemase family protein [Desulfobacula sp.]|uniref:proline racemase family protein n=1 Tax=Desulfobacula sp. TaxID=2593537 RepID=UPI0025C63628|nr:proline racemase family protein [Desulfobacula sp.]MCD4720047.1 proline racemase family protein [Desulfobacula sp.]